MKIVNKELIWNKNRTIISKTDCSGKILYMNDVFEKTSGYNRLELIGKSHNVIRHPDMPKVLFKKLWQSLNKKEKFHTITKNRSRCGRYYWVMASYTIDRDKKQTPIGYTAIRKAVPKAVIDYIEPFYKILLEIEKTKDIVASEKYFHAYLKEEHNKTYEEFILNIVREYSTHGKIKERKQYLKHFFSSTYVE